MKSSNNIYTMEGVGKVFRFTLTQTFKNRAYRMSLIVFVVMMMVMGPLQYLGASAGMNAAKDSNELYGDGEGAEHIYLKNDTAISFGREEMQLADTVFGKAEIIDTDEIPSLSKKDLGIVIDRQTEEGAENYVISGIIADESELTPNQLDELCSYLQDRFSESRMDQAQLAEEQLTLLNTEISTGDAMTQADYERKLESGYTTSQVSSYMGSFSIIMLILIMLSTTYVVSTVMEEKTSKLVENLLVSVRPMALVMGKILAMMCYVFILIVLGVVGSKISNGIMQSFSNGGVPEQIGNMMNFSAAFSIGGIKGLILIPCMLLTYLIFSVLAGLLGSACTKPEDASSATGTVVMLNFASYLAAFIVPAMENAKLDIAMSLIPPFSCFMAPVYALCGRIPVWVFLLSLLIQCGLVVFLIRTTAHVYRKLIVHDQKRLGLLAILRLAGKGEA